MQTSKITYKGNLRTEATHLSSGNVIISDAPVDNHGKGEAFSPTDLLATSLALCMLTIMGIVANNNQIEIIGTEVFVTKIMASNPRRVSEIIVEVNMPKANYSDKEKKLLENAAITCPVAKSLHPDIKQEIVFTWDVKEELNC